MGTVEVGEVNETERPAPGSNSLPSRSDKANSCNPRSRVTLIAHSGNLLVDLPLYGLPVLALILALAVSTARFRRSRSRTRGRSRQPG